MGRETLAFLLSLVAPCGDQLRLEGSVSFCLRARVGEGSESRHATKYESVEEPLMTHPGTMASVEV